LYTDGACSGNPGPGGWAAILMYGEHKKEMSGADKNTTNNRMELLGIINGLKALKESCAVNIFTDSKYVCDAFLKNWIIGWQKNGWKTSTKQPVKNRELWEELLVLLKNHEVSWNWVKGHAQNQYNNRCDELARTAIKKLQDI